MSIDGGQRESHVSAQMTRLAMAIEEAEKAQASHGERIAAVLRPDTPQITGKDEAGKPSLVPLACEIGRFAERVSRLASQTQATTARVEL